MHKAEMMMSLHQRLRLARKRAGFRSAAEAARALRVPYGTYSGHESGSRGFSLDETIRYAQFYGVGPNWLALGEDVEGGNTGVDVPVNGIISAADADVVKMLTVEEICEYDLLPRIALAGPEQSVIDIKGNGRGVFNEQWCIYVEFASKSPDSFIGRFCVCSLPGPASDDRYLRIVEPGSREGVYDLRHEFLPTRRDVVLSGVQPVIAVIQKSAIAELMSEREGTRPQTPTIPRF